MLEYKVVLLLILLLLTFLCQSSSFFTSSRVLSPSMKLKAQPSKSASSKVAKTKKIEKTRDLLQNTTMILVVPNSGIKKEQIDMLRKSCPPEVVCSVIKNTLLRRAVEGTQFEILTDHLKLDNLFLFIPDGCSVPVQKALKKWQDEYKRDDPTKAPRVLVAGNTTFLTKEEMLPILKLPSKKDLLTKLVFLLKSIPTRLVLTLKRIPIEVMNMAISFSKSKVQTTTNESSTQLNPASPSDTPQTAIPPTSPATPPAAPSDTPPATPTDTLPATPLATPLASPATLLDTPPATPSDTHPAATPATPPSAPPATHLATPSDTSPAATPATTSPTSPSPSNTEAKPQETSPATPSGTSQITPSTETSQATTPDTPLSNP